MKPVQISDAEADFETLADMRKSFVQFNNFDLEQIVKQLESEEDYEV
ncbi:MAG: hypothetical protein ACSLEY_01095 [Candidatus Saccharimonadales bacterium]